MAAQNPRSNKSFLVLFFKKEHSCFLPLLVAERPDRHVQPPVPPARPARGPERTADEDADRREEAGA